MCSFAPAAAAAAWCAHLLLRLLLLDFAPAAAGWSALAASPAAAAVHLRLCTVGALGLHVRSKAVLSTFECR